MNRKKENDVFRVFSLIAICFVVDGHIPLEGELMNFGGLFRYYSFHLMMFAFSSGYFFDPERSVKDSFLRDLRRLILPLYLWNLGYGILAALLRQLFGATLGMPISAYTLLLAPITDGQHFAYNLGAWFVGTLFLCKTAYRLLALLLKRLKQADLVILAVTLITGGLIITLYRSNRQPLPLFLCRALILLPGYAFGVVYKNRLEKMDRLPALPYLSVLVLVRLLLCAKADNLAYLLSDCTYFPTNALLLYLSGATGIAFYLRISRILAPHIKKSSIAQFAARHTFDIMMHHKLGFWLVNFFFLLMNYLHLGAPDFSVASMRTMDNYTYAPQGHGEFAVLYLAAGVIFSCLVAYLIEKGKEKVLSRK